MVSICMGADRFSRHISRLIVASQIVAGQLAIVVAVAIFTSARAQAADPPDPLRLVPPSADLVVKIQEPRALAELAVNLGTHPELEGFRAYRDYLGSTNYQLFRKVVGHFEHELGHSWTELLDDLAGGGIVVAIKIEVQPDIAKKEKAPVLFILQGKSPAQTAKFFETLVAVATQERARSGLPTEYKKADYHGIETWAFHDELFAAALDTALVYSNREDSLHAAIDQHLDAAKPSLMQDASLVAGKKLLPASPLVWAWVNLETLKKNPDLLRTVSLPSNFFPLHVVFGGMFDVIRRSPFMVAALHQDQGEVALSVRFPRGTDGMNSMALAHVPAAGQVAALPLLEPERTLLSSSVYLDPLQFWNQRKELVPSDQLKQIEAGNEKSSSVLYGTQLNKFLEMAGARHRVVIARQKESGYKTVPKSPVPAGAVVLELRDADGFVKAIDGPIRGLAFLGQIQYSMTSVEEQHGKSKIIGYRFVENETNKARDDGYLFNFSPCRAQVGDMLVISSTVELARQMIDELEKAPPPTTAVRDPAAEPRTILHHRVQWSGISQYLGVLQKRLVTQNMLEQGNAPEDAAKEISLFLSLLDHLGRLETENRFSSDRYEIEARFIP